VRVGLVAVENVVTSVTGDFGIVSHFCVFSPYGEPVDYVETECQLYVLLWNDWQLIFPDNIRLCGFCLTLLLTNNWHSYSVSVLRRWSQPRSLQNGHEPRLTLLTYAFNDIAPARNN